MADYQSQNQNPSPNPNPMSDVQDEDKPVGHAEDVTEGTQQSPVANTNVGGTNANVGGEYGVPTAPAAPNAGDETPAAVAAEETAADESEEGVQKNPQV